MKIFQIILCVVLIGAMGLQIGLQLAMQKTALDHYLRKTVILLSIVVILDNLWKILHLIIDK